MICLVRTRIFIAIRPERELNRRSPIGIRTTDLIAFDDPMKDLIAFEKHDEYGYARETRTRSFIATLISASE